MIAAVLAHNDAATTGKLHPLTHKALDRMWTVQREDGGWGLATLGGWKRSDGKEQDKDSSGGYGTGFVIYLGVYLPCTFSLPHAFANIEMLIIPPKPKAAERPILVVLDT